MKKIIDFQNDTFKIALMTPGFIFYPTTQKLYTDISAYELPTANGYTATGAPLTVASIIEDTVNQVSYTTWSNVSWSITSNSISTCGAIIYDTTPASPNTGCIVGYIDFGGTMTTNSGGTMTITNIAVALGFGSISVL
jgi:hypothetical protein